MDKKKNTADDTKARDWPNTVRTREELDSALEAGLKSGVSDRTIEEVGEHTIARLKSNGLI